MENHFAIDSMGKDAYAFFSKPAILETCADLMVTMVPIWMAIVIGLVVGWSWKPRWVSFLVLGLRTRPRLIWSTPPGFGTRRLWLALTAITAFPFLKEAWSRFRSWMWPNITSHDEFQGEEKSALDDASRGIDWAPTTQDLIDFCRRLNEQDGGSQWSKLMERSTDGLTYHAWRREPLEGAGPTEYRSRSVFEDVTAEEMRDFFWDDEFRIEWDDMLLSCKTWESCPQTGSMLVQWVRKFPVFCKDREYTIGRRIWSAGNTFYCITKGVHYPKIPRQTMPRRVDVFFSSWRIRPVESQERRDGRLTSCEVMLFHHEDMGIQRDIAKLGVRQGMWGCVKKMQPGLMKYRKARKESKPKSNSAIMANITTRLPPNFSETLSLPDTSVSNSCEEVDENDKVVVQQKSKAGHLRWFILGGAVALACGVDSGAVGKILVFGIARKLGRRSRRHVK